MTEDGSDQRPKWMQVARDMASALIVGVWGYAPSGIQEQSSWSGGLGKKPHEAESCLKIKWAILRSGSDYLSFWCFQIFSSLLLTCCIRMPLCKTHILHDKTNLLESSFGGWIIHVWGCLWYSGAYPPMPLCHRPWYSPTAMARWTHWLRQTIITVEVVELVQEN